MLFWPSHGCHAQFFDLPHFPIYMESLYMKNVESLLWKCKVKSRPNFPAYNMESVIWKPYGKKSALTFYLTFYIIGSTLSKYNEGTHSVCTFLCGVPIMRNAIQSRQGCIVFGDIVVLGMYWHCGWPLHGRTEKSTCMESLLWKTYRKKSALTFYLTFLLRF